VKIPIKFLRLSFKGVAFIILVASTKNLELDENRSAMSSRREYHISAPSPPCVACGASGKGDLCCLPNTCKEGKCGNGNDGANNMEWNGISLIWL